MKQCCFWLAFSFLWEGLVYSYPLSKGVAWDLQEVNYRVWRWSGCPVCWNLSVHRSHWIADLCEMNCPALNFFLSVHHELEYQVFLWGFSSLHHTRKDDSISVLQRGDLGQREEHSRGIGTPLTQWRRQEKSRFKDISAHASYRNELILLLALYGLNNKCNVQVTKRIHFVVCNGTVGPYSSFFGCEEWKCTNFLFFLLWLYECFRS